MSVQDSSTMGDGAPAPKLHLVPFHDDTLVTLERNGAPYVAMRRIVQNMGLDWARQSTKLAAQERKFDRCLMPTVGEDGAIREMVCIPLDKLNLWLACVNPNKVAETIRPKLERYQAESAIALHDYWTKGAAVREAVSPFDGTVTDLSPSVRQALGGIVKGIVHKELASAVTEVCTSVLTAIMPDMLKATLASQTMIARRGRTAGQLLRESGFPPLKGLAPWFGNKLEKLGYCAEGEGRADHGDRAVRIFDPDRVRVWLREGGRETVERKIAIRRGQEVQNVIRLVAPPSEAQRTY